MGTPDSRAARRTRLPDHRARRHLYRLESADPDRTRAAEWQLANAIRRSGGSAMSRVERLLVAKVGAVVTREQIDYVAEPAREGSRRLRQLRDEFGWPIDSHIDEPNLEAAIARG